MILADVLKIVLLVATLQTVLICWWLLTEGLAPSFVDQTAALQRGRPWRTLGLGLALGFPLTLLGLGLAGSGGGPIQLAGFAVAFAPAVLGLLGSASFCRQLGRGLFGREDEGPPGAAMLRGGTVLTFVFLTPLIGWFVVFPGVLAFGLGSLLTTLAPRRRSIRAAGGAELTLR